MNKYMVVRKVEAVTMVEANSMQEALDIAACMATHEFDCGGEYRDEIDPNYGDAVNEENEDD